MRVPTIRRGAAVAQIRFGANVQTIIFRFDAAVLALKSKFLKTILTQK